MTIAFFIIFLFLSIVSYGFIDPNLILSSHPLVISFIKPLFHIVYQQRLFTAGLFFIILLTQFFLFRKIFINSQRVFPSIQSLFKYLFPLACILVLSYPMVSYDLFNYMTTAKVTFTHLENPYIVMPIEIANEPNLFFTRAANKLALYGPIWILLTWIPHALGMGNIWQTIISFKLMSAFWYLSFCFLVWRVTKNMKNVIFFALNPLVLIEVLVVGHNDLVMMALSLSGILLWESKKLVNRISGLMLLVFSMCIKGATVVLLPLLFLRKFSRDKIFLLASFLLLILFIIAGPIREELYPWYAIWFLSSASFLSYPKYLWFWQFGIVFSLGLELRYIPYMAMGYYEGPGPMLRTVLTIIPVVVWGFWKLKNFQISKIKKS